MPFAERDEERSCCHFLKTPRCTESCHFPPRARSKSLAGPPLSRRLRVGRKPLQVCALGGHQSSRFQTCCCHMMQFAVCSFIFVPDFPQFHVPNKNYYTAGCSHLWLCCPGGHEFLAPPKQEVGCMHELRGHGAPAPSLSGPFHCLLGLKSQWLPVF